MNETFKVTPEMLRYRPEMVEDGYAVGDEVPGRILHAKYSRYMQRVAEVDSDLVEALAEHGARFTHHSSIAPTGTISLSLANNASNGVEPSFAHHYSRNVIREGKKSKEKVDVYSFELLAYRAMVNSEASLTQKMLINSFPITLLPPMTYRPSSTLISRRRHKSGSIPAFRKPPTYQRNTLTMTSRTSTSMPTSKV